MPPTYMDVDSDSEHENDVKRSKNKKGKAKEVSLQDSWLFHAESFNHSLPMNTGRICMGSSIHTLVGYRARG
jgi:hypothetical protein